MILKTASMITREQDLVYSFTHYTNINWPTMQKIHSLPLQKCCSSWNQEDHRLPNKEGVDGEDERNEPDSWTTEIGPKKSNNNVNDDQNADDLNILKVLMS